MDAHLLHLASKSLEALVGSRISKIYQYDDDIYVFSLYGRGKKQFLTARTGKNMPFLFLSDYHNARGENPPASVMRLRKYLGGKRIINMYSAWWDRTIFFQVKQDDEAKPLWFKIDLKKGALLCDGPFEDYKEPEWKELESIDDINHILDKENKDFSPFFTPPLRKTMREILKQSDDEFEAFLDIKQLVIDLESGEGDLFLYTDDEGKKELYAWQLPQSMQENKVEEIFDNPIFALNEYGKSTLFSSLTDNVKRKVAKPFLAQIKKLKNLRDKLETEEDRLQEMFNRKELAIRIQSNLYLFDKDHKAESIEIDEQSYPLDRRFTLLENMENLFHQSHRGKRGLVHLVVRKQEVEAELEKAKESLQAALLLSQAPKSFSVQDSAKDKNKDKANSQKANQKKPIKTKKGGELPKQVLYRESKDGFTILLGKDTKGNGLALKLASPNDYWLHTADGASAHAIIKRDHQGQVVPESTFEEAGIMVAEKSPFKNDEKALIQYAFAKNIQPMRNAGAGMVRIVKSEGSFWVSLADE